MGLHVVFLVTCVVGDAVPVVGWTVVIVGKEVVSGVGVKMLVVCLTVLVNAVVLVKMVVGTVVE